MFRAAQTRRTLLSAAAIVATGPSVGSSSADKSKLSIYPKEEPVILLEPDPSRLELEIRNVRLVITDKFIETRSAVQQSVERWIGVEQHVESASNQVVQAKDESITPGILYVGVAGLTGSILARGRVFPVRFLLPPALFIGAMPYFLPRTTANISAWLSQLEHAYVPEFAKQHDAVVGRSREIVGTARAHSAMTLERVKNGAEWAVGETQRVTGLQLREAFSWAKQAEHKVEAKVAHAIEKAKVETKQAAEATKKEADKVRKV
ncbi:apolipo protein O-domain-containing protein [Auriculariales sp. MPI-PUGE-AT-0066]|nr:apolipo protein O-domain-containing protein [Auriculariales sp. MPI-PUGE-AT-0066]